MDSLGNNYDPTDEGMYLYPVVFCWYLGTGCFLDPKSNSGD